MTHQAEVVARMLADIEQAFDGSRRDDIRTFITGSGAGSIAEYLGARFVQEAAARQPRAAGQSELAVRKSSLF